jgi:hypothetical protein
MECLECGSSRVEELMLYRCPDCGAEVVSVPPRKLHPAVLPSDYQQTIDALRVDLARCKKERDKSKELALEVMKLFACDLLDGDMPTDADLNNLQRKFAEVGLEDEFDLIFAC